MPRKPAEPAVSSPDSTDAQLLTEREVRRRLGDVSRPTLNRWRSEGKFIRPIKLSEGGAIRYRADELEAWLAGRPRA
jgi:predicted DNA-binding transcriptional regulator AlpA